MLETQRKTPHSALQQRLALLAIALLANGVRAADSSSGSSYPEPSPSSSSSPSPSPSPTAPAATIPTATARATLFDSLDGVSTAGAVLAILAMVAGLAMLIAGFKLFRATLFALGFAVGGALLSTLAECVFADASMLLAVSGGAFAVGGLLAGFLVQLYRDTVGVFFVGAVAGAQFAVMAHTSFGYRAFPSEPIAPLLVLVAVFGTLSGWLAVRLEKPALILATSFLGASLLVWGVGYFAGDYPSATHMARYREKDADTGEWIYTIPSARWIYHCVSLLIAIGGVQLQSKLTARGIERVARGDGMDRLAEDAAEASSMAVSRRIPLVVVHARRDRFVDMELGTPQSGAVRSNYTGVGS